MAFSLKNKTAIVTGGCNGIGNAIALVLSENGAKVHVLDTQTKENTNTITYHQSDITTEKKVTPIIAEISENDTIDILINNAGIGFVGSLENTTEADLDRLYNVNIKGVFNCSKAVIATMKNNGGTIINMASIASSVGIKDRFAYSMTKGAVLAMTYSIAKDYIDFGIRCNSISPARVHTTFVDNFVKENYPDREDEMFQNLSKTQPIGRMGTPEEVAHLALYLCSNEASYITGTDFPIDGGFIKLNGN